MSGEQHISVTKAATFGGMATIAAMGTISAVGPSLGYFNSISWTSYDFFFISASVSACCGLLAQVGPELKKQHEEGEALSPFDTRSSTQNSLDEDLSIMEDRERDRLRKEWSRWEQGDKTSWDAEKRQRWAERLWHSHKTRVKAMRSLTQEREELERRRKIHEERERRKKAQWGGKSR